MQQCDVAVIADLVVENPTPADLEQLTLELTAEPPVLGARSWHIDRLGAQSELRLQDRRVTLAGGLLGTLTERMRAELRLRLCAGDAVLAEHRLDVVALAHNEWGGGSTMPELLAAFVTPNDPAVAGLLREASGLLSAAGRSGALEGYQARSRQRSWEILQGIWAAVSARGLTYAEPPASFESDGQKIRSPADIEAHGLATCLDLALLFAAAIEQAGLHPLIVLTRGHALAGAWLQPQTLPALLVDDAMELRKAADQQDLVLFETTMATAASPQPFARAIDEARRQIDAAHEEAFGFALDVRQARARGIHPLGAVTERGPAAAAEAIRAGPGLDPPPDLPPFDADTAPLEAPQTPAERIERWKRSLLDLSKRNRLLNLRPAKTVLPIFCPDLAQLEDQLASDRSLKLVTPEPRRDPDADVDRELYHLRTGEDLDRRFALDALARGELVVNVDPDVLEQGALELYRKARTDFQEGGSNTLFLAVGMLRWSPGGSGGPSYRAPLILLPVQLERASAASKPKLRRREEDPLFNLTLLEMLRQDFQIELPGLGGELPADDDGLDVARILDIVRARVREVPGFEVVEEVVLSTFSFAKYLMWKDLAERTDALKAAPFVRHLIDHPHDAYAHGASFLAPGDVDAALDPAQLMTPLHADASQVVAVHASGNGGDFVLEGPPGTGKSETIGNIIAQNLALGHRVLFVSEKMAALEVVYRRLANCGLGDFCLELHSAKVSKRAVLDQLGAAWTQRESHDAADWEQKARELATVRQQLNRLVAVLHEPGPGGISPRAAIGRAVRYGDVHRFQLDWPRDASGTGHAPTPQAHAQLEEMAGRLGQEFARLQPEDFAAFAGLAPAAWSHGWQGDAVVAAHALQEQQQQLLRQRRAFVERLGIADAGDELAETAALAAIAALVPDCAPRNLRFALSADGDAALAALGEALDALRRYREQRPSLAREYPDERLAPAPVEAWLAARAAAEHRFWPLRLFARRSLRREIRAQLGLPDSIATPEQDLERLRELGELRERMERAARQLPAAAGFDGLQSDLEQLTATLTTGRALREQVTRLAAFGRELAPTRERLAQVLGDERELLAPGMPIAVAAQELVAAHAALQDAADRFAALVGTTLPDDFARLAAMTHAVVERSSRLKPWCEWIEACRDARELGLGALVTALEQGTVPPARAADELRTAYARWVAPILIDAREELRRFSGERHAELIRRFRELDRELAELTSRQIRARLSAGIPSRDAKDSQRGFGVLAHELHKQRRHKPVRQLIAEMGPALTTLTPCLMMSPLSVAQFLPADATQFDIVVFDEASQITVPDAIGAIARGRRCIVVGDPKQMPPTRFFERGPDEESDDQAPDLESILDEALAARVPHHRLTGHYRSRHESLICFSNHAYYDGALVTYPSADTRDTAVSLRRVDGIYAKGKARTNPIEAQAVVAEVVRRLRDPELSQLSLGIVTLNLEQQRLVEDLLDQERRTDGDLERFFGDSAGEPVFVKNLETVQGDQRDVILLSVGYGPTEPGAPRISMNFGPLNRQGGERRLNVAITRATTEVLVFASFDSSMIDLTRTSATAVEHLKGYLDFAARGPLAIGAAATAPAAGAPANDFELAVAEGLRARGWQVRTQIGVSKYRIDLGIVDPDAPNRFLAGIECDGASYHGSPSARDRDRLRHLVLQRLGWTLLRLWSTDYFLDPATALTTLDTQLQSLREHKRG